MKIFCIGLSKTGTTSLTEALRILGFDAVHWYATKHAFRYTADGGIDIDWDFFERHDAFADTPIARIYPQLDERYPDAKFILTQRNIDAWVTSFADQFAGGGLDLFSARLHRDLYGTDGFDAERCRRAFLRHTAAVEAHFAGRRCLLRLDIEPATGWEPLCRFLGAEHPSCAFPHRFSRSERRREWRRSALDRFFGRLCV
ncbi:sulfotransferase family protein [Thiohalocapsa halophila]